MGCPSSVVLGNNFVFSVCTHDPDTGVLTDASPVPSYRIYEDETATAILNGNMAKLDDANTTGFYTELIAATAGNGFEDGKTYTIYIEATVDSDKGGICYGLNITTVTPDALWDEEMDPNAPAGADTAREYMNIFASILAGITAGTDDWSSQDLGETKTRTSFELDADGMRTARNTLDGT